MVTSGERRESELWGQMCNLHWAVFSLRRSSVSTLCRSFRDMRKSGVQARDGVMAGVRRGRHGIQSGHLRAGWGENGRVRSERLCRFCLSFYQTDSK